MKFFIYLLLVCFPLSGFSAPAGSCKKSLTARKSSQSSSYSKHFIKKHSRPNFDPGILRKGDIRGKFLTDFDFGFAEIFAESLAEYLNNKTSFPDFEDKLSFRKNPHHVLIAHDARLASFPLSELIAEELAKRGIYVGKLGLVPTPVAYHLLEAYQRTAAVILTASHNPKEYAGIKTVLHPRYKIVNSAPEMNEIILANSKRDNWKRKPKGKIHNKEDFIEKLTPASVYSASLKHEFQDLNSKFPYSFVVDASHGSSGPMAREIFESLGLKAHYINSEPDGNFPNHEPDPTKEKNLESLKQKIKETDSQFGIAFDGDGDRIVLVAPEGEIVLADHFAYFFLEDIRESHPENPQLIVDVRVSNWFINKAEKMGFQVTKTKTGYYFLKEEMRLKKAVMAFEQSAHIIFNDRSSRGYDDGIYNALRFIELIHKRGLDYFQKKYNEVKSFKTRDFVLRDIDRSRDTPLLLKKLKDHLDKKGESYEETDGVRVSRGDAWGLFRFSNTEDVASITVQAKTEKETLDIVKEFSQAIGKTFIEE